jgi:phospholipid/cholesterol/gamma-HCH transport system substrate-binding protein
MTRLREALVGAFVIGGLLLFGGGLFLIGDRRLLFAKQFELNATFGKITGLRVGTPVRLAGLDAGEVLEIQVPASPSLPFRVRMRVREDLRQLVRTDSVPAIQTDGIVGNAFIQISFGTEGAPVVSPGAVLRGRDPIEFADLIQEGQNTFRTIASEVVELRGDVSEAIGTLTDTAETASAMIGDVGKTVDRLTASSEAVVRSAKTALDEATGLVADVRAGHGSLGRLVADDAFYEQLLNTTGEVEQSMKNLREMTDRTRELVTSLTAKDGSVQQIAVLLRTVLADVQESASDLAEGTEALKRNFLFRGFFRDRGFFDLDSVSREAYQAGALERDRTALRIWIDASALFVRDPVSGEDRLSDDGRMRIDSAMADLVRYPRDSPLVVEGYAESAAGEAPYLRSVDRAQLVRNYLLARFRRQATLTDIMPMGDRAVGSPSGNDSWSGVALALFVRNDALGRTNKAGASQRRGAP